MEWLSKLLEGLSPVHAQITEKHRTLVLLCKFNVVDLPVCQTRGILRERRFRRTEKLDFYHQWPDGSITITPG